MATLKEIKRYPDTNSVEATWVDGEVVVKCHSYDQVQMDMLAADLGADLAEYQWIIDEVNANFIQPVVIPKTDAEIVTELTLALEAYYDEKARDKRYDNRLTCALRAGYIGPFQAEGIAFATWMDTCNAYGYQVLAECLAGTRTTPTEAELIAELPAMAWP